jgi:hypothetical protein
VASSRLLMILETNDLTGTIPSELGNVDASVDFQFIEYVME